jgi:7,8-dihydropterin-6-yl-methyl-4-(beta-D-ribofuranosyl)aminobenzene 5'-phosphate synthase
MQITTLVENSPHPSKDKLKAEHGLSFYIEHSEHVFMSDVGMSGNFADNAVKIGVDLTKVDALAITHHHYDHGGGLARFMHENSSARVYLRSSPQEDFIAKEPFKKVRYIGLDQQVLKAYDDRIVYLSENYEILPSIHLLTEISQAYPKPVGDKRLRMKRGSRIPPDTFEHELVTVLGGEEGLVVLTGCAHNGVLNMIAAVRNALPGQPIQAVIGGFHLKRENETRVRQIGEALLDLKIPAIYTGHCTGEESFAVLKSVLGDRLQSLHTGLEMSF